MVVFGIVLGLIGATIGIIVGLAGGLIGLAVGLLAGSLGLLIHVFPIVLIVLGTVWLVNGSKPSGALGVQPSPAARASPHNSSVPR